MGGVCFISWWAGYKAETMYPLYNHTPVTYILPAMSHFLKFLEPPRTVRPTWHHDIWTSGGHFMFKQQRHVDSLVCWAGRSEWRTCPNLGLRMNFYFVQGKMTRARRTRVLGSQCSVISKTCLLQPQLEPSPTYVVKAICLPPCFAPAVPCGVLHS